MCYCSFETVSRGQEERQWALTVKELRHISTEGIEHPMHTNPFYYKVHQKATAEYQALVATGKRFRTAIIPFWSELLSIKSNKTIPQMRSCSCLKMRASSFAAGQSH